MGHPGRESIIRGERPRGQNAKNANIHKGNSYKLLQNKHHCIIGINYLRKSWLTIK